MLAWSSNRRAGPADLIDPRPRPCAGESFFADAFAPDRPALRLGLPTLPPFIGWDPVAQSHSRDAHPQLLFSLNPLEKPLGQEALRWAFKACEAMFPAFTKREVSPRKAQSCPRRGAVAGAGVGLNQALGLRLGMLARCCSSVEQHRGEAWQSSRLAPGVGLIWPQARGFTLAVRCLWRSPGRLLAPKSAGLCVGTPAEMWGHWAAQTRGFAS